MATVPGIYPIRFSRRLGAVDPSLMVDAWIPTPEPLIEYNPAKFQIRPTGGGPQTTDYNNATIRLSQSGWLNQFPQNQTDFFNQEAINNAITVTPAMVDQLFAIDAQHIQWADNGAALHAALIQWANTGTFKVQPDANGNPTNTFDLSSAPQYVQDAWHALFDPSVRPGGVNYHPAPPPSNVPTSQPTAPAPPPVTTAPPPAPPPSVATAPAVPPPMSQPPAPTPPVVSSSDAPVNAQPSPTMLIPTISVQLPTGDPVAPMPSAPAATTTDTGTGMSVGLLVAAGAAVLYFTSRRK